jgi:hypothetical protein
MLGKDPLLDCGWLDLWRVAPYLEDESNILV